MSKSKSYSTKTFDNWSKSFDKNNKHSRFWIGADDYIHSNIMEGDKTDVIKLLGFQRAVSNFVRIVTGGADITVKYSSKDNSYTDGKTVVLSSKVDDAKFDVNVGLALHEGSHCILTNFTLLKSFHAIGNVHFSEWADNYVKPYVKNYAGLGSSDRQYIKDLWNVVEDRRIDNYIYKSSPGYKGYYQAMYDEYFNAPSIDVALRTGRYNTERIDDYMFHIINFANPNRKLDTLKGLREIWSIIDLANISRLKTSEDTLHIAFKVYGTILKYIDSSQSQSDNQGEDQGDSNPGNGDGSPIDMNDLSPKEQKAAEKALKNLDKDVKKQYEFIRDEIKKKRVTRKTESELEALKDSDISMRDAGYSENDIDNSTRARIGKTQVLVVKGMSRTLLDSELLADLYQRHHYNSRGTYADEVTEGLSLGALLGRRLKVRTEDRTLTSTRLAQGKISKRLVNELGYGNANVFEKTLVTYTKPAMVHLSIDASGSMCGSRFGAAIKTAMAIAKAGTMISNLRVIISLRGTTSVGGNGSKPIIWIPYDSNKDNLHSFAKLAPFFYAGGSTPESLCYESILKDIIKSAAGVDSYLINLSDGEPGFANNDIDYHGMPAVRHCARIISTIKSHGVKVLSFFINSSTSESTRRNFDIMYHNSTSYIDVNELNQLSITLNKLFATGESITA